jgi:hypothetical protein
MVSRKGRVCSLSPFPACRPCATCTSWPLSPGVWRRWMSTPSSWCTCPWLSPCAPQHPRCSRRWLTSTPRTRAQKGYQQAWVGGKGLCCRQPPRATYPLTVNITYSHQPHPHQGSCSHLSGVGRGPGRCLQVTPQLVAHPWQACSTRVLVLVRHKEVGSSGSHWCWLTAVGRTQLPTTATTTTSSSSRGGRCLLRPAQSTASPLASCLMQTRCVAGCWVGCQ